MRHIALAISLTAISTASTAQTVDWGNLLQQGVNEVIRSMNTPAVPPPSSSKPVYIPSSPPSPVTSATRPKASASAPKTTTTASSAAEQDVDARIGDMLGNPAEFRSFFNRLKSAAAASDKKTLAAMMKYPLTVPGASMQVSSERQFIDRYDAIFTPNVLAALKNQTYSDLFVRDQGAMIGGGEIWFTGVCADNSCNRRLPKVVTVNPN